MKQDEQTKLENRIQSIQNNEKIAETDKEVATQQYVNYLERIGVKSASAREGYLRFLEHILEENQHTVQEITKLETQKLKELNEEIIDGIQNNQYKRKKGSLTVDSKKRCWRAWRRLLETQGIQTEKHETHIPTPIKFTSKKENVDTQADTQPEDLPTPKQMRKFLKSIENVSHQKTGLRNVSLFLFLWDTGARIGEALPIQMKQVTVQDQRIHVNIKGNKKSKDRKIEIFQGRKTLKDYIQTHPKKGDPDAYLFPPLYYNDFYSSMAKSEGLKDKIGQAKSNAGVDFKTHGEPFHIFRKAMSTFYVVNDVLDWEEVCVRQGKKPDNTMDDYLKQSLSDVDSKAATGFGLDSEEVDRESDNRMTDTGLLPRKCTSCETLNRCYYEVCQSCGKELPESSMPKNIETDQEGLVDMNLSAKIGARMAQNPDKTLNEIKEEVMKKHGN